MKILQSQLLLLLLFVSLSQGTILITSPAINPFNESKIPYSYTNVGSIPYGKTLTFDLVQKPDIDFCTSQNITKSLLTDPTYVIIENSKAACSFVMQALNAQSLGAKGVLIVSDAVNYFQKMVPIDDGNGRKVHISVLMISNQTNLQLKTIKNTQIKVQFEVYKSKTVNLTYFLSASGRANYIFLREFQPYYQKISFYINFKPLYLTFPCRNCPQTQCLINQNYCIFEMDTYVDGVGQYILKEQIRQWNIYKQFGVAKYFSYMNEFDKLCTVNWYDSENCGINILSTMNLKNPSPFFTPTELMGDWRKQEMELGFMTTPQLTINTQLFAGTENAEDVFNTICSYLLEPPTACFGEQQPKSKKGHKVGWIIASIIIAFIVSIGLGMLIYRKCVKKQLTKDMFSKVNELVARYATKVSEHNKKRKDKLKMRLNEQL